MLRIALFASRRAFCAGLLAIALTGMGLPSTATATPVKVSGLGAWDSTVPVNQYQLVPGYISPSTSFDFTFYLPDLPASFPEYTAITSGTSLAYNLGGTAVTNIINELMFYPVEFGGGFDLFIGAPNIYGAYQILEIFGPAWTEFPNGGLGTYQVAYGLDTGINYGYGSVTVQTVDTIPISSDPPIAPGGALTGGSPPPGSGPPPGPGSPPDSVAVPEPGTLMTLCIGFGSAAWARRRRPA